MKGVSRLGFVFPKCHTELFLNVEIWNLKLVFYFCQHDKEADIAIEDESKTIKQYNSNSSNNKYLRFFGDTDQESDTSTLHQSNHQTLRRYKSNGNSGTNGTTRTFSHNRLQVPSRNSGGMGLRHYRSAGDVATSSAESTTEGDSSQQSQRSVVYLHAATGEYRQCYRNT